jgi:hypothetical protein
LTRPDNQTNDDEKNFLRYCRGATIIITLRPLQSHFDCRRSLIQIDAPQMGRRQNFFVESSC